MSITRVLLPVLLLGSPISASAQARESTDAHLRNNCPRAARIIGTGRPEHRRAWAFDTIRQCDISGPPILAEIWRTSPPSDHEELWVLSAATGSHVDVQLFEAVMHAAEHRGYATTTRVYAISLVTSYAAPGLYVQIRDLWDRDRNPRVMTVSSGPEPPDAGPLGGIAPGVRSMLEKLATHDADPIVRRAASEHLEIMRAVIDASERP